MTVTIYFTPKCDICGYEHTYRYDDSVYVGEELFGWNPEGWDVIWPENRGEPLIEQITACPDCYQKHKEAA